MTFRRKARSPEATWILVADAGRARVFNWAKKDDEDIEELIFFECEDALAHPRDLTSDRQGYFRGRPGTLDAGDPHTGFRRQASRRFAHEILDYLERGRLDGRFGHLIIMAAPAFLGTFRSEVSGPLSRMVERTVPKDLTSHTRQQIAERLQSDSESMGAGNDSGADDEACFAFEFQDEIAIVTPICNLGEFGYERIYPEVEHALRQFATSQVHRHVIIDLRNTDYFGSSTIGLFTRLWKLVRQRGGSMVFCHLSEHEREVLRLTRFNTLWPERETLEDAIAAVRQEICSAAT